MKRPRNYFKRGREILREAPFSYVAKVATEVHERARERGHVERVRRG